METGEFEPRLEIAQTDLAEFATRVAALTRQKDQAREFRVKVGGEPKVARLWTSGSVESDDLEASMVVRDASPTNGLYPYDFLL